MLLRHGVVTVLGPTLRSVETDRINYVGENQERNVGDQVVGILVFVDDVMSAGSADDARRCIRNLRVMEIHKKFSYGLKKTKIMILKTGREEKEIVHERVREGFVTECDTYKYVGFWVNEEGNCLLHLKKKKEKMKGEMVALKSVANYYNMGKVFLNARLELYQSCTVQSILFNLEGWNRLTKNEMEKLETIQAMCLCSLLGIPKTTPYIGLLNELGIWTMEKQMTYRKLMFYHNLLNSDERRLCKRMVIEQEACDDKDTFYADVMDMASSIGLSLDIVKTSSKAELKTKLKKLINQSMVNLVKKSLHMSKLRFVNPSDTFGRKQYLLKMDGFSAVKTLKTRLNMLPVYGNFKGDLTLPRICKWCDIEEDDTTEHFLTCTKMGVCNITPEHLRNEDDVELWNLINKTVDENLAQRLVSKQAKK